MTLPPEEIRLQLDRLLASGSFAPAERLKRFLRYVVERALAGEGDRLKEYVIGVEVFDRDERYDPRMDSIVRVEAGRLRAKLDEYYRENLDDTVLIQIRRGSYVPAFERREPVAVVTPASPPPGVLGQLRASPLRFGMLAVAALLVAAGIWRAALWAGAERAKPLTTIVVMPFTHYATDNAGTAALATRITDGVTSELVRSGAFSVIPRTVARQHAGQSPWEVAKALNADIVVEAIVQTTGERVSAEVRLISRQRKFRVEELTESVDELPAFARRIASAIESAHTDR